MSKWTAYKRESYPEKGKIITVIDSCGAITKDVWRCNCGRDSCPEIRSDYGGLMIFPMKWHYQDLDGNP